MNIDWNSNESTILINPRFPEAERQFMLGLLKQAPALPAHFWIATSGSTAESVAQFKWVALSKEAALASAAGVNRHLQTSTRDIWLNPLPDFHAGGLSIYARAHLSGSKTFVYPYDQWKPHPFCERLVETKATLTALVPAEIYDLVVQQIKAPERLRAVIVGGGKLSENLYQKGRELGWPLLPSYGLTESCSQVATAPLALEDPAGFPPLEILPHAEIQINEKNLIKIKSKSLLTCYAFWGGTGPKFADPKIDGWFQTDDQGEIEKGFLKVMGRRSNFVKIGGESVDLSRLEKILEGIKIDKKTHLDVVLVPVPDNRLGHVIHLAAAATSEAEVKEIVEAFQTLVLPYERIRQVHVLESLPRTALNKIQIPKLLKMLDPAAP